MAEITLNLCAALFSVEGTDPKVLTIPAPQDICADPTHDSQNPSLPFGQFLPAEDLTLDQGLRRNITKQTHASPRYIEQLYTFGDHKKDHIHKKQPHENPHPKRAITLSYLGLLSPGHPLKNTATWHNIYDFFPWEYAYQERAKKMHIIFKNLEQWANTAKTPFEQGQRRQRLCLNFGLEGTPFDSERVLERYQLLYEAGLVVEAYRDYTTAKKLGATPRIENRFQNIPHPYFWAKYTGKPMVLNHRRVLAGALQRMRGKIKYRPLIFELLPEEFTLLNLQQVAEALAGTKLHKQNFRRLILNEHLVEDTGKIYTQGRGRPAALYKFRKEVRYERTAVGVGLPLV